MYFISCSFVTSSAMSFERHMGIFYPLAHRTKVTKGRLLKYIICSSLVTFILATLSSMFDYEYVIINGISTFIFLVYTTFVYTRIFVFAKKRFRSRSKPRDGEDKPTSSEMKENCQFLQETKLAKSCFLIVVYCMFRDLFPACLLYVSYRSFGQVLEKCCVLLLHGNFSV